MNNNPLAGYFRKPAIHMTLPSTGNFYPEGSLEMPETKELPVYPMTALDEITYRTPDALFNGSAIVEVIKSCIPSIKDPWAVTSADLPAILTNIRIASFGHIMKIDTTCPKCSEQATYELDLRNVIDTLQSPDYSKFLKIQDIDIFFKPLSYKEINKASKLNFEEEQLKKIVANHDMSELDKIKALTQAFAKVSEYSMQTMSDSIYSVRTPESTVTDKEYILDFLKNIERQEFKLIKDKIVSQRSLSEIKPIQIVCDNKKCKHKYQQPFTLDMTAFFG